MSQPNLVEPWLRGTLTEVHPVTPAVLHALELAQEDLWKWCYLLTLAQLNRPCRELPRVPSICDTSHEAWTDS